MKLSITLIVIFLIASHWLAYDIGDGNDVTYRPIPIVTKMLDNAKEFYNVDTIGYDGDYFYIKDGKSCPVITDEFCDYVWGLR